jgi:predicted lactoylglutathione lyase
MLRVASLPSHHHQSRRNHHDWTKPFDKQRATVGNGVMVALMVDSTAKVDALHRKALQLGGSNEGAPGPRGEGFYAGYFRDLDGNKLNFFCAG